MKLCTSYSYLYLCLFRTHNLFSLDNVFGYIPFIQHNLILQKRSTLFTDTQYMP